MSRPRLSGRGRRPDPATGPEEARTPVTSACGGEPSPTRRVADLFDALSDTYDQVGVDFFAPIGAGLVQAVAPRPGERVLDLGCGRGAALIPLARAVGPEGHVVGADLSARMVEQCRRELAAAGLLHVQLLVADAQEPDWGDTDVGGLDVVVSSLVLFFLPDPAAAVARWCGLLRPGGRLGVATFGSPDLAWARVDEVFRPFLPPGMLDARTSGASGPFASDEGIESLLEGAGCPQPHTTHLTLEVEFADAEQWYAFSMSVGQRAMWMAVPPEHREGVKTKALALLGESARPDGSLGFVQDVRYTVGHRPQ
ncbi:MAG: methyltransferase domain-containing protein [Actinomycetota bacterium]|nr:methyltransferase domain-containing protein [Actinomycetota bacterium]